LTSTVAGVGRRRARHPVEPERASPMVLGETTVHVVRHGRTALNEQGRFRGLHDVPLDDRGRAEAEAVARRLGDRPVVALFSSPLTRARETAEPIARRRGIDAVPFAGLLDLDHGEWTELSSSEAEGLDHEEYERFRSAPRASIPPGGEPLIEAERRIVGAIDELGRRFSGREIVVVSHEIPIRLLLSRVSGLEGSGFWNIPLPTGSVSELHGQVGSWRVEREPAIP
jgi:broad specificity phosphatase PhoE